MRSVPLALGALDARPRAAAKGSTTSNQGGASHTRVHRFPPFSCPGPDRTLAPVRPKGLAMRIEKSVTSLSWIPSEAIKGPMKAPFEMGITHYDEVPPDAIGDVQELRQGDRFRFVNHLSGWVEVEDGVIVDAGFSDGSGGVVNSTTVRVGRAVL